MKINLKKIVAITTLSSILLLSACVTPLTPEQIAAEREAQCLPGSHCWEHLNFDQRMKVQELQIQRQRLAVEQQSVMMQQMGPPFYPRGYYYSYW